MRNASQDQVSLMVQIAQPAVNGGERTGLEQRHQRFDPPGDIELLVCRGLTGEEGSLLATAAGGKSRTRNYSVSEDNRRLQGLGL